MYETGIPKITSQAVFDWELMPFTDIKRSGAECPENFYQIYKNPRPVFTICALGGGKPYSKIDRADENGNCPQGTAPCSTKTSAFNTICYPQDQIAQSCPITEVIFKKKVDRVDRGYKRLNLPGGGAFLYTKTEADSRPITAMQVLQATYGLPCADPTAVAPACNVKDTRYSKIQDDTDDFFGHYFWTRQTIEWNLSCSQAQLR